MANFEKAPAEVQEILSKPIQQLGLKLEGSPLERFVHQLYKEKQTIAMAKTKGYIFKGREVVKTEEGERIQLRFAVR